MKGVAGGLVTEDAEVVGVAVGVENQGIQQDHSAVAVRYGRRQAPEELIILHSVPFLHPSPAAGSEIQGARW